MVKHKLDDEIDDLFRLPLAEFTSARNGLAARLKKERRVDDAERVKLLSKPSITAWAVNQLYWDHRDAFDDLIATGKRFRAAKMRDSLDARREALTHLMDLAEQLLRDAGHNPALDTMRRITTTLEALSAHALLGDGPTPGRLTNDVDPPSFESLASLMSRGIVKEKAHEPAARITPVPKPSTSTAELRQIRQAKIAAAKSALQEAKATHKKASSQAKEADELKREAEEQLKSATAASHDAAAALEHAKRMVEDATKHLESLLRESV